MPTSTPTSTGTIAKMRKAAKAFVAARPGYDQSQRWSFYDARTRKFIPNREADCSTCCGAIAHAAGYLVDITGTFYTGNFAVKMKAAGFDVFEFSYVGQVRQGDFIVSPGAHVEFAYSTTKWCSARYDERGRSSGGRAGDQGDNVGWGKPYDMSKGGTRRTYIVRPPQEAQNLKPGKPYPFPLPKGHYFGPKEGSDRSVSGYYKRKFKGWTDRHWLRIWQTEAKRLGYYDGALDGEYGPKTAAAAKKVQKRLGIRQHGLVSARTWAATFRF